MEEADFPPIEGVWYRIVVSERHVEFIRGILEASEGLACMYAKKGGNLLLLTSECQAESLAELVEDLRVELGAIVTEWGANGGDRRELF